MLPLDTEQIPGAGSAGGPTSCFWVSDWQTGRAILVVSARASGDTLSAQPGSGSLQGPQNPELHENKQTSNAEQG